MIGGDGIAFCQICDCTGKLENAVEGAGGEVHLLHCGLQQFFCGSIDIAKIAYLGWPHLGVAGQLCPCKALKLALASGLDALPNLAEVSVLRLSASFS